MTWAVYTAAKMAVRWARPASGANVPASTPPNSEQATGGSMNTGWTCEASARAAGTTPDSRREMGMVPSDGSETHKISGRSVSAIGTSPRLR
ncbi:hypothetical protein [Halorussus caseinilyticus]|uniref:Uncharacterized protein n=1 Tax=Halorussus caseinilyticus TaxID=3034025 RepID=A0ABD5WQU1_9EURY